MSPDVTGCDLNVDMGFEQLNPRVIFDALVFPLFSFFLLGLFHIKDFRGLKRSKCQTTEAISKKLYKKTFDNTGSTLKIFM